jgi:hypothetical protein
VKPPDVFRFHSRFPMKIVIVNTEYQKRQIKFHPPATIQEKRYGPAGKAPLLKKNGVLC